MCQEAHPPTSQEKPSVPGDAHKWHRGLALRLLAASHFAFFALLVIMFCGRWWEGDVLVQCGLNGRPYDSEKCVCGGSLPTICWISDGINGVWGLQPGMQLKIVWQSYVWLALSTLPASTGAWLLKLREQWLDVLVGLMSWAYLVIGLLPDTLPNPWVHIHFAVALFAICSGLLFQLCLPWRVSGLTTCLYVLLYFALTEITISKGAKRSLAYDWTFSPGVVSQPGSLVPVILEWVLVLGSIVVAMCYCVAEDIRYRYRSVEDTSAQSFIELCVALVGIAFSSAASTWAKFAERLRSQARTPCAKEASTGDVEQAGLS
eukprot:gb/GFBE01058793.1/.p1 GENE.gb/GFBE01058793.1/~~gb/GFBE01058793.1/.p1  ORF type:complete len:318 (+),score=41.06 gb/GFBE01058793.1/:1-954(+)